MSPHAASGMRPVRSGSHACSDPRLVGQAGAQAQKAAQIHEVAPNNTIYNWHIGDPTANDAAMKKAKHVTRLDFINNRLVQCR